MNNIVQMLGYSSLSIALTVSSVVAGEPAKDNNSKNYSPYAGQSYPENVYWGDTHLHSNLSIDAYNYGDKNLSPDDAYRFAKGEPVVAHNGETVRLSKPLEFGVVHSGYHLRPAKLAKY